MNVTPLLDAMAQEVAERHTSILEAAEAEAEQILATAHEARARRKAEAFRTVEAELTEAVQRSRERAEAEAEMALLTTKDTITNEILTVVAKELKRLASGPRFPAIFESLLEELLRDSSGGEVVLAPPVHVEHCRRWLLENGFEGLDVQSMTSLEDGVAVQNDQCSFRITNTLSSRLAKQEGLLRKRCIARLLEEDSDQNDGASE